MICPLWSGSDGIPSVEAALRHDTIESDELRCLEAALANEETGEQYELSEKYPAALVQLLRSLNQTTRQERKLSVELMNNVNSWRCKRTPFPYSTRLLRHVNICSSPPELNGLTFDTPAALLNMRRSQHQIADDLDETIKNFIVCVPKADSQPPIMETNANVSQFFTEPEIDRMLLQPVREALCPFRRSKARLSSFFPDRKLVQFDAGKLQTLAELLRELKRGGHRALVFTQMSKMLDILETFLNLNGHTYLRLDGSTSVERRQRLMDRFNSDPKVFCFILSTRSGGLGINLTGADSVIFYDQDWNPAMYALSCHVSFPYCMWSPLTFRLPFYYRDAQAQE
jgi:SNF2 family DNA or RNA helicase